MDRKRRVLSPGTAAALIAAAALATAAFPEDELEHAATALKQGKCTSAHGHNGIRNSDGGKYCSRCGLVLEDA